MREQKDRSRYYRYMAYVLAAVFLVAAGLLVLSIWESDRDEFSGVGEVTESKETITFESETYHLKKNVESFMVLGLDKFSTDEVDSDSYRNDKQADFIFLLVIDNDEKTCRALQINRDTMTTVNILGVAGNKISSAEKQITLAHTYGNGREVSCRNTADALSALLGGVKIDYYASLTMDAVPVYNDLVGGVEVEILDDFTGIDDTLVKGETVTLTGESALNYVRSRYGLDDSTNINRMARQRQYIKALAEKSAEKLEADSDFAVNAAVTLSDYMVSNRTANQLSELAEKLLTYEILPTLTLDGESKVGEEYMEFHADRGSVNEAVVELFYKRAE